ncbi:hypothetical protein DL769_003231 [Monosporascus sp. CRB-8-3]|nr:hypothetical protein DL769_003231 [Monosporascus sp. CRB-8-3]
MKDFYEARDKKEIMRPRSEGKIPFTRFLLSCYQAAEATVKQLVADYILINFDSTPSTASALFHVLFTLQHHPEKLVTLSVGPTLPAGVIIAVNGQAINRSPDLWPNPDSFNMDRFYRLRQKLGNENRFHFLTTGSDSPGWGDGTHACPGRFFATNTLKIALARFLKKYGIEMKPEYLPLKHTPLSDGSCKPDDT